MRKILFVVIAAMIAFFQGAPAFACDCNKNSAQPTSCQGADACEQHRQEAGKVQESASAVQGQLVKAVEVGNKICPVMGGVIAEGTNIKYEYKGRIYSFCCAGCPATFQSDPEKYSKIADDEVANNKLN
jgi:YHS domain-containing protein